MTSPETNRLRTLRVAAASADGVFVDHHFRSTPQFLICDITPTAAQVVEVRANLPATAGVPDDPLGRAVGLVADCAVVLATRAGSCAAEQLQARGIRCIETNASIAEAIRWLLTRRPDVLPTTGTLPGH
jgi:predicted Fe-Mo cluster-binding NifX family protein